MNEVDINLNIHFLRDEANLRFISKLMMKIIPLCLFILLTVSGISQDKPYFYQIPEYPGQYSAATVAARMVDGLGFRYYWATEGLTDQDLRFKPGDSSRTSLETIEHIFQLTQILNNAVHQKPTVNDPGAPRMDFSLLREKTLRNLEEASKLLKKPDASLTSFPMIFKNPNRTTEFPFWNLVNGPIADALWHVGQIVSFRRSSGNPFPDGVSVLQGTKR